MITILAIVALNQGIATFFNYNILASVIPKYAKWVFGGAAAVGGYLLYTMFKKR